MVFALCAFVQLPVAILNLVLGQWLIALLVAIQAASMVTNRFHLRAAFNWGWCAGRAAMALSLCEAVQRDMPLNIWLSAEAERDVVNLRGRP